jgi:fatty acid/phospholipid biosynthesis enzyme
VIDGFGGDAELKTVVSVCRIVVVLIKKHTQGKGVEVALIYRMIHHSDDMICKNLRRVGNRRRD